MGVGGCLGLEGGGGSEVVRDTTTYEGVEGSIHYLGTPCVSYLGCRPICMSLISGNCLGICMQA